MNFLDDDLAAVADLRPNLRRELLQRLDTILQRADCRKSLGLGVVLRQPGERAGSRVVGEDHAGHPEVVRKELLRTGSAAIEGEDLVLLQDRDQRLGGSAVRCLQERDLILGDQLAHAIDRRRDFATLMVVDGDVDGRAAGRGNLLCRQQGALAHHVTEERTLASHGQIHAALDGDALTPLDTARTKDVVERTGVLRLGIAGEREAARSSATAPPAVAWRSRRRLRLFAIICSVFRVFSTLTRPFMPLSLRERPPPA